MEKISLRGEGRGKVAGIYLDHQIVVQCEWSVEWGKKGCRQVEVSSGSSGF